jgi:tetratricopeptide (TPR) repeat protein
MSRELDDALQQLTALSLLAEVRSRRGDHAGAWSSLEEAVFLAKGSNAQAALASLYHAMGILHEAAGKEAQALTAYERALHERRQAGDGPGLAITLNNMAALHHRGGDPEQAKKIYREALLALGDTHRERPERGIILDNLRRVDEAPDQRNTIMR